MFSMIFASGCKSEQIATVSSAETDSNKAFPFQKNDYIVGGDGAIQGLKLTIEGKSRVFGIGAVSMSETFFETCESGGDQLTPSYKAKVRASKLVATLVGSCDAKVIQTPSQTPKPGNKSIIVAVKREWIKGASIEVPLENELRRFGLDPEGPVGGFESSYTTCGTGGGDGKNPPLNAVFNSNEMKLTITDAGPCPRD
jgi:hypothetical protein